MIRAWLGLPFGAAFGFLLSWGRMTDPEAVRAMLLFREPDMFLFMGSAMAVGFVGVRLLRRFGARSLDGKLVAFSPTRPAQHHVAGSVLFGLGWGLACTCPGPAAALLGQGSWEALAVVGGLMTGVALRATQREAPAPASATVGL